MARRDKASSSSPTPVQIVQRVMNETNPGWLEHQERERRFNRAYDVYRANVKPSRTLKPWQSRLYVKYGMQVIDQALVNIVQGSPQAVCTPRREEDEDAARAMEVLLGYYADQDHLAEKESIVAAQALIYGVSPAKTHWYYKEVDRRQFVHSIDEYGQPDVSPGVERIVECDRPCFTPWNAYDCWWDPYARDVESASYVIFRDYLTKKDLEDRRFYEDRGTGTYKNLDLLYQAGPGQQPSPTAQNQLLASPVNLYKDRFEILEIWRDQRLTVIGNRQILLYDGLKPFWMPGKPCVISCTRPDLFRIEGISETELVDHLQQALHTITNLRMDNMKFTVQRGGSYREAGVQDPSQLVMRPAYMWPVTDHGDIEFHDPPHLPPEAYTEEETLIARLQYVTGITPYISGAATQPSDQKTATGVSLLQESASRLLAYKANQIRLKTWQHTFEQWADLTRQFLTAKQSVLIQGEGKEKTWAQIGPQEVMGDYDVRIRAGEESLSRQQERAEAIAILTALAPYAQAGMVNLEPLLERVAEAYNLTNRKALFPPQNPQQQVAAPNNGGGVPQSQLNLGNGIAPNPVQSIIRGNAR